jgi:anti-anti-sigma factor
MEISREKSSESLVIRLAGRLDASWCDLVEQNLTQAVREGEHVIQLDMERVDYISSAGLRVILSVYKQLTAIKGSFSILKPSSMVLSVLSMVSMDSLIKSTAESAAAPEPANASRTFSSPRAAYELFSLPGKGVRVETIGDESLLHGGFNAATSRNAIGFGPDTVAVGIGALGANAADCAPRFGEFLAAGGAAVFQPADGSVRPDFLIHEGTLMPEGHLLLGLVGRGDFSTLARFHTSNDARTVGLGEIASTALEIAGTEAAFVVALTETSGLVGATLQKSPISATTNNFGFPQIRDWLSFTSERAFRDSTSLVVGIVAREGSPMQSLLRPVAPGLQGHFHAACFTYRPLQKGFIELKPTLTMLFEGRAAQGVIHLLNDSREFTGAGESEFLRGAIWIAPVLP